MSDAEIEAVKNKGEFLDLHDATKLSEMRLSTWYKDSVTDKPVPIMLTVQVERKVRERFGLTCPDVDAEHEGQPNSPRLVAAAGSVTMDFSPATCEALRSAFNSASSSSDSVVLGPSASKKLKAALDRLGTTDSLARD